MQIRKQRDTERSWWDIVRDRVGSDRGLSRFRCSINRYGEDRKCF